jgi:hypothetical protein
MTTQADATDESKAATEEGPGCLPALLAIGAIILMILFISCGLSTWWLYNQRTEIAVRTIRGSIIPEVQQSLMSPEEKRAIVALLTTVAEDGEAGKIENWQAAGIMERLSRSPLLQWGNLIGAETLIQETKDLNDDERRQGLLELSRLKRALEVGKADGRDLEDVLSPLLVQENNEVVLRLNLQAPLAAIRDVILRAKLVADREQIEQQEFVVLLAPIIEREIAAGRNVGGT